VLTLIGVDASFFDRQEQGRSVVDAAYNGRSATTTADTNQQTTGDSTSAINQPDQPTPEPNERLLAATEIAESIPSTGEPSALPSDGSSPGSADIATQADETTAGESPQISTAVVSGNSTTEARRESSDVLPNQVESNTPISPVLGETQPSQESSDSQSKLSPALLLVRDANPTSQFVQHIVLASAARAEEWLGTQNGLDRAIVLPVSINNTRRFAVVSGPFESRGEVRTYIQGMDQTADYWVRTARSLQRIAATED
jgi:hypothetical protein